MILFSEDWNKYPNAVIHLNTKNKSFLKYAYILREMGIANNAWPLALLDPELMHVDPFDPKLSDEMKLRVVEECKENIWYYLREVARFPAKGGADPIPYEANRGNMALTWSFMNHIDFALIMIRQSGKSGSTDQIHNYVTHVAGQSTSTQIITKDNKLRKANIERIKKIRDELPPYMHLWTKEDADNTQEVTCKFLGNNIETGVAQKSEDGADNLGRGLTAAIQHIDEAPYIANIDISIPVALASGTAARDLAAKYGGFYGNIFTTTAGKLDTKEGAFIHNMINKGMYWNETILDSKNLADALELIKNNSKRGKDGKPGKALINGTFSHKQIGKSDEWLREAIVNTEATEDIANRDFFNKWSSGSLRSPLTQKLNTVIRESEREPLYYEVTPEKYQIRWHIRREDIYNLMNTRKYIMGLDTSNAIGKDNNGLVIVDSTTLEVVAQCSVSEANLFKYAKFIAAMLIKYRNITLVPENKASGQSILDIVVTDLISNGIDPFTRIFNRLVGATDTVKAQEGWKDLKRGRGIDEDFYIQYKSYMGFMTSGGTRTQLYNTVLQQAARSVGHLVKDKVLIDELLSLVEKNGRVDHPSGGHDDSTISWLLANWFLRYGQHLEFYGLSRHEILTSVNDDGATTSPAELRINAERNALRQEIDNLKEQLAETTDFIRRRAIEAKISLLTTRTEADGGTPVSLNQVLNEAKEASTKKNSLRERLDQLRARRAA